MVPVPLTLLLATSALAAGWPDLSSRPESGRVKGGRDTAVVIGIEDYAHLPDIPGAAKVARDWQEWLVHTQGLAPRRTFLLTDAQATRESIATAVADAALEVGDDGTLWIVFIGHGATTLEGQDAVLLPVETRPDPDSLLQAGEPLSSVLDFVGMGSFQNAVLVLDTSFSGMDRTGDPLVPGYTSSRTWIGRALGDGVLIFLAAGDRGLARQLPGGDLPAFSWLALGALRGWGDGDRNGEVKAGELLESSRAWTRKLDPSHAQVPEVRGKDLEVGLSRGKEPAPDLYAAALEANRTRTAALQSTLQAQEAEVVRRVAREWSALSSKVNQDPVGQMPEITAFLDRNSPLRLEEDGVVRWVDSPALAEARKRMGDLTAPTTAQRLQTAAGAQHVQQQEEIRRLAERNAWKGVETAFQDILALQAQGEHPTAADLMAGAQAARALGSALDVRMRLVQAYSLAPTTETVQWLNAIESGYGAVALRSERKEVLPLEPVTMPFAPDMRAAIEAANQALAQTRRFDGLLPEGLYRWGGETLLVLAGDSLQSCNLTGEGCRPVE